MTSSGIRSRYVMAGGIRTHYSETGDGGPVIVLLHGGAAGSSGESGMGALMKLLGQSFRVIAPDSIGGFGQTDPAAPAPYGMQSRVDHLENFADALCLERFALLGSSQGAWCAAKYATLHPDRVSRLVLVGSARVSTAMGLKEDRVSDGMKAIAAYDGSRDSMKTMLNALVYDKSRITDAMIDLRQAALMRPGAMEAYRAWSASIRKSQQDPAMAHFFDLSGSLPAFTKTHPTMFIWGEEDICSDPIMGRRLEPLLPDMTFHWVPKAGHQVQTDRPEIVAGIIERFMAADSFA